MPLPDTVTALGIQIGLFVQHSMKHTDQQLREALRGIQPPPPIAEAVNQARTTEGTSPFTLRLPPSIAGRLQRDSKRVAGWCGLSIPQARSLIVNRALEIGFWQKYGNRAQA